MFEISVLLRYYVSSVGDWWLMFWERVKLLSLRVKLSTEFSTSEYQTTGLFGSKMQCHIAEDWRHQRHCCKSLQTRPVMFLQLHQQNAHCILIHIYTIILLNVSVCLTPTSERTLQSLLQTICFYKAVVWGTVVASQNMLVYSIFYNG